MALLDVAVQGLTLTSSSGTANVTSVPNTNVKVNNFGVYVTPLAVAVSGASQGNCVSASGSGVINATAVNTKVDNQLVMRNTDQNTAITVNGSTSPGGSPCSFTVVVTIAGAGQTDVQAD